MTVGAMSAAEAPIFNVTPAEGSIDNISRVILTPTSTSTLYMYDRFTEEPAYLSFKAEGATEETRINLYPGESRAGIEFIPETVIYTPGECELVVPGGTITGFDMTSPTYDETVIEETLSFAFTVTGGITNPESIPFTVSPEPGTRVETMEFTLVSTDESVAMTPNQNPLYSNIYFAKDGRMICLADAEPSDDGLTMVVKPAEEITAPGVYSLIFAYRSLYLYDPSEFFPNAVPFDEPMCFTFSFKEESGVAAIEMEKSNSAVYNLHGVKVADSTEALRPGIYITEGKKVIIK